MSETEDRTSKSRSATTTRSARSPRRRHSPPAAVAAAPAAAAQLRSRRRTTFARGLYDISETTDLPAEAVLASLGCGNPTALADLQPGDVVLDLGSGGGIDVLLSARRVGPTGKAYGLDMTDEMLALARQNQEKAGVTNVEFLKGEIEAIPLPDESVDVIVSNCVDQPLPGQGPGPRRGVPRAQARRPVRRLRHRLPGRHEPDPREAAARHRGVVRLRRRRARGAGLPGELRRAGFADAAIEVTKVYDSVPDDYCIDISEIPDGIQVVSGFVRAIKPSA